ncbi:hypothetical protein [Paucibacter sp. B51]|uniref:hypothetical protein n=1 Tax=Paucibacter sp. B51 TaxID=2993315 RepID=UPI0022EBF677|nr:hypothetical protein [Paucibacter sp. B51]
MSPTRKPLQRQRPGAPRGQSALHLEPAPEHVWEEAERLRLSSSYWRQRTRSLEELLADPQRARTFLNCARGALIARQQRRT